MLDACGIPWASSQNGTFTTPSILDLIKSLDIDKFISRNGASVSNGSVLIS